MKFFSGSIKKIIRTHYIFLFAALIFGVLLFRNPFSQRTQIANLEPFPDSIHYISPALSILRGEGPYIVRESRRIIAAVPPLYSLTLLPGYLLNQDVRMFYFMNVVLSFVSLFLFYLLIQKIFPSQKLLQLFLVFLYTTNYILYWFPQLAMAENLILPLFLGSIYILIHPATKKGSILLGMLSVAFYATKFASLPMSAAMILLSLGKILFEQPRKNKLVYLRFFLISLILSGISYLIYEHVVRGVNSLSGLPNLFFSVFAPKNIVQTTQGKSTGGGFFSLEYAVVNINAYGRWLLGEKITFLWKQLAILPKVLQVCAMAGIFISLATKKRWVAIVLLTTIVTTLFFMMSFYAFDGRYFLVAVPISILGFGLFVSWISTNFGEKGKYLAKFLLVAFALFYLATQVMRLKFDVMLNLKYSETPWYYISVRNIDTYLQGRRTEFTMRPVVISALPPYLVDFYTKEDHLLLPLHKEQEFRSYRTQAWGEHDYENLHGVYTTYLEKGHTVLLTGYGLGNEKYLHDAFDSVLATFNSTKVFSGCHDLCNIYELSLKKKPSPTTSGKRSL